MKAVQLVGPQRLELVEIPEVGPPGADEAIVRVAYVALNHLDLYGFRGMAFAQRNLPMTVGVEAAGVVEQVGAGVDAIGPGERVVIYPADGCAACRACLNGRPTMCRERKVIMGFNANGMAVERLRIKARQLIRVPANVSLRDAACTPITMATVQRMLFDNAQLCPGETVLVHAAGSGIGSVAIRMAKAIGARVIATAGNDGKCQKALALGADHAINYSAEPFHTRVRKLTQREGVDVVFEHTGEATWEGSILSLAKGGRLVTCGSTSGFNARTNLLHIVNQQIKILASFGGTPDNVVQSLEKLRLGTVAPVIDAEFELSEMNVALKKMSERDVFGKIMLRCFGSAPALVTREVSASV